RAGPGDRPTLRPDARQAPTGRRSRRHRRRPGHVVSGRCCPRPQKSRRVEVSRGYGRSRAPVNEKTYACLNCLLGPTYGSRRLAGRLWRRYAGRRADVARGARNGIDEGEPVEFLLDYADFLLRTLTVVVAI